MIGKRLRDDAGVAMVEFAMVAVLFFLIFAGVVDLGDAYVRNTAAVDTVRAASIVAFDAGEGFDHDLRVVGVVVEEARSRRIHNIESVVIYNADVYDEVPPACLDQAAMASGGVAKVCTVYGPSFFDRLEAGTAKALFTGDCATSADKAWCAPDRLQPDGWTVGIHVRAEQDSLTGLLPFFRSYSITESTSVREFKRVY